MKIKQIFFLSITIASIQSSLFGMLAQDFQKWEMQRQRWLKEQDAWYAEWKKSEWTTPPKSPQELEKRQQYWQDTQQRWLAKQQEWQTYWNRYPKKATTAPRLDESLPVAGLTPSSASSKELSSADFTKIISSLAQIDLSNDDLLTYHNTLISWLDNTLAKSFNLNDFAVYDDGSPLSSTWRVVFKNMIYTTGPLLVRYTKNPKLFSNEFEAINQRANDVLNAIITNKISKRSDMQLSYILWYLANKFGNTLWPIIDEMGKALGSRGLAKQKYEW